jgi:DNA-binding NtrC family response regulator
MDMSSDLQCAIASDANVLISGGNASVRAALARLIYERGTGRARPFVTFCRPSASDQHAQGFEPTEWTSSGGTLFIDDISALERDAQASLMRLLERRAVTATKRPALGRLRVIAGTALRVEDLPTMPGCSAELFYRLNTIHIVLSDS